MFAYPTEAYTHDACESEQLFRAFEHDGALQAAVDSYGIGLRSTEVLRTLAYCRVWSKNIGVAIWPPQGTLTQTDWDVILDKLVAKRLGKYRCLSCGNFHNGTDKPETPFDRCSQCGGASELIGGVECS